MDNLQSRIPSVLLFSFEELAARRSPQTGTRRLFAKRQTHCILSRMQTPKTEGNPASGESQADSLVKTVTAADTYRHVLLLGAAAGVILAFMGLALCLAGLSGSVDWFVSGPGWQSRLTNASPGIVVMFLGVVVLLRYKPKIKYNYDMRVTTKAPPGRTKLARPQQTTRVKGSGTMGTLPPDR